MPGPDLGRHFSTRAAAASGGRGAGSTSRRDRGSGGSSDSVSFWGDDWDVDASAGVSRGDNGWLSTGDERDRKSIV